MLAPLASAYPLTSFMRQAIGLPITVVFVGMAAACGGADSSSEPAPTVPVDPTECDSCHAEPSPSPVSSSESDSDAASEPTVTDSPPPKPSEEHRAECIAYANGNCLCTSSGTCDPATWEQVADTCDGGYEYSPSFYDCVGASASCKDALACKYD